ncbi:hypothetical protein JCM10908_001090 [Rhodotorula pacifica]|uniref:uncharacterized protein n=1 Tax=Rhodotorula pacifica TaxID=1495444 RepID=UPI003177E9E5
MPEAVAGPSAAVGSTASTSSTSSPVRPTAHSSRRASVEPYDSPLREGDSFASYGSGGHETDSHSSPTRARRGNGDLGDIQTVIYSKRDSKGKGKARASEYGHAADVRIPVQVQEGEGEETAADDEAEERRIQENLAKWSKADAERRAALRRSSRLAQTTVVPPPAIPGASNLIRRTSTILRTASQRRKTSGGGGRAGRVTGGLTEEELELAAAGEVQSPVLRSLDSSGRAYKNDSEEGDLASRRDRRKLSLKLDSIVDLTATRDPALQSAGTGRTDFSLPRVGEEGESAEYGQGNDADEGDALRTPTSEHPPRHTTYGNPFSGPSQVSLASTATAGSSSTTNPHAPQHARGGSVFIENLPPLPQSPAEQQRLSQLHNPFATPNTSPVKSSTMPMHSSTALRPIPSSSASSFASSSQRDPDNPFIDVVVTSPSPAKPNASSASLPFRPISLSQQSLVSLHSPPLSPTGPGPAGALAYHRASDPYYSATAGGMNSTTSGHRPSSPAYSASSNPSSPLQGSSSGPRRRRSYDPRSEETAGYDGRPRSQTEDGYSQSRRPQEEEVSWLSWLFCGCLRPENENGMDERDGIVEQRGRTNPME